MGSGSDQGLFGGGVSPERLVSVRGRVCVLSTIDETPYYNSWILLKKVYVYWVMDNDSVVTVVSSE